MGKMNRDLVMYITTCTVPVVLFAVLGTHTLSGEKQLPKALLEAFAPPQIKNTFPNCFTLV